MIPIYIYSSVPYRAVLNVMFLTELQGLFSEDNARLLMRASWWALYLLVALIVLYVCVKLLARMDQYMKTTPPPKRRRPPQYYYNDL